LDGCGNSRVYDSHLSSFVNSRESFLGELSFEKHSWRTIFGGQCPTRNPFT
jgi:hypothetical protein